jgi:uncharacterized RDD family membrane protein YckC
MTNEEFSPIPLRVETIPQESEPGIIAGFWKRLFAFLIDGVILGIAGLVIGLIFFDAFASLGGWGRLVGFIIALLYFGLFNGSVGKGQTIGKRATHIKVVDRNGQFLSLNKSFLRYTVLTLPYFLNGALLPLSVMMSWLGILIGLIIFGVGGSIIYLYIFNRGTRQSLHDLVVGSFVVRDSTMEPRMAVRIWQYHFVIIGIWWLIILVFGMAISPGIIRRGPFPELLAIHNSVVNSGKVHVASVSIGTGGGPNGQMQYLSTNAVWKNRPESPEIAAAEIAAIVLNEYPDVMKKDMLVITITYGFDIGIASGWQSYNEYHSPAEWKLRLQ